MTAQELKNSILQLAFQGKLVPQNSTAEPVAVLLKQIAQQKAQLIKSRIRKKEKSIPAISDEEIPFDIPENWLWVRLGDYCLDAFSGKSPVYSKVPTPYAVIGQAANQQAGLDYSQVKFTVSEFWNSMDSKYFLIENDVLLNTLGHGTLGRSGIVSKLERKLLTDGHLFVFRLCSEVASKYFYYFLQYKRPEIEKSANGSTNQTFLSLNCTNQWLIPIPPLAEQERIVAKIEELIPLIEEYDEAEQKLYALDTEFPDKLRKSILQQAVQSKLTERDPADEPAAELLRRVCAERVALQKNKLAKKSQAAESVAVDEIPFDLPDTCEWVNLGWICQKIGAGSTPKGGSAVYAAEGIKLLREQNVHDDGLHLEVVVYIDEATHAAKSGSHVQAQDILMNITGASIGRNALVPDDFDTANVNQHVLIIRLIDKELRYYLHYCFSAPVVLNQMFTKQVGDKPGLSATKVENFLIPLPPLAEQKRIVARVEELLAVCDG